MGYASNIIKGTGTGAATGAAFGPWGAAIGGSLGALAGVFAAWDEEDDKEEKKKILEEAKVQFGLDQDQIEEAMEAYYNDPESFLGTQEDVEAYRNAIKNYNADDYVYNFDPFSFTDENGKEKTVEDYMTPYYDQIIQDTTDRVQHSAAGGGVGRGTGAANAIATAAAEKEDELYKTALQQYNTDRAQSYTEWAGNIDKMQNRLNQLKAAKDTELNNLGTLSNDYTTTRRQKYEDEIAAKQARSSGNLQLHSMGLNI